MFQHFLKYWNTFFGKTLYPFPEAGDRALTRGATEAGAAAAGRAEVAAARTPDDGGRQEMEDVGLMFLVVRLDGLLFGLLVGLVS